MTAKIILEREYRLSSFSQLALSTAFLFQLNEIVITY